jgi:hypothetical protein
MPKVYHSVAARYGILGQILGFLDDGHTYYLPVRAQKLENNQVAKKLDTRFIQELLIF